MLVVTHFVAKLPGVDRSRLLDWLLLLLSRRHLLLNLMLILSLLGHALLAVVRVILFLLFHLEATTLFECRSLGHVASLNLVLHIQVERRDLLFGYAGATISFIRGVVGRPFLQFGRDLKLVNEALLVDIIFGGGIPSGAHVIILQYVLEVRVGARNRPVTGSVHHFGRVLGLCNSTQASDHFVLHSYL